MKGASVAKHKSKIFHKNQILCVVFVVGVFQHYWSIQYQIVTQQAFQSVNESNKKR